MKLTETQLVLLSAASQREDHAVVLPDNLKGGAAHKVVAKLLTEGLAERSAPPAICRSGVRMMLKVFSRSASPRRDLQRFRLTRRSVPRRRSRVAGRPGPPKSGLGARRPVQRSRVAARKWHQRWPSKPRTSAAHRFQAGYRAPDASHRQGHDHSGHRRRRVGVRRSWRAGGEGIEVYRGAPLFNSLGSFLFQTETPPGRYPAEAWDGVIVDCGFRDGRCVSARVTPIVLNERGAGGPRDFETRGRPSLAAGAAAARILDRLVGRSRKLGVTVTRHGDSAEVRIN